MMRLACLLALVALGVMAVFVLRLSGETAIWFVFLGMPSMGLALACYAVARWRMGAFGLDPDAEPRRATRLFRR